MEEIEKLDCKITVSLKKDDTSTIDSIKHKKINIYYQLGNGYGNSLREAIDNCETEYFCIFNADGSFDYKDIHKMYNLIVITISFIHLGISRWW